MVDERHPYEDWIREMLRTFRLIALSGFKGTIANHEVRSKPMP